MEPAGNPKPTEVKKAATGLASAPPPDPTSPLESQLLKRLLDMADCYRGEGSMEQAKEIYFSLVERHVDAPEAEQARERLMEIADHYETTGQRRWARSMYERLL